jgi:hypothetical protein
MQNHPAGLWSPRPPRLRLAAHAASGGRRRCSLDSLGTCLAGAVVQPTCGRPGLRAGGVVDGNAGCDVHGIHQGQSPLYHMPLSYH